ncbi:MAG TPA: hypothetical protein VFL83_01270 [Anaeromyxobacter sp.]|nr:hypothetical protein [Anaeromyxobacter sp.]
MTPALLLALAFAAPSPAAGARDADAALVLVVASNRGTQPGRTPLRYADDDAAKYFEVFSTIAGRENAELLTELDRDTAGLFPRLRGTARPPTRPEVERAAAELGRRAAELARSGRAVRFYFVFAGHGDVDDGRGFLELSDGPFTADDLQRVIRTVGAPEAHVILDSCNSFFVVNPRKPGGARFATPRDAADALSRRLPNVGVFLSTSAKAEVYEWSELQSGVFSHAVRSGLMGAADADADGAVTYAELAAFIDTATADIKNPLYRPAVYARGPNGEDGRELLSFRGASRVTLAVDDPRRVRLAARDADGLRWIDTYKEAGGALELWLPPSLAGRVEVDRLKTGPGQRGEVEASFALAAPAGAAAKLSSLAPAGSVVAMRGPGEIFQALFSRPFGPEAFATYLEVHAGEPAGVPESAWETLPPPARARPAPRVEALVRGGAIVPIRGEWDGVARPSVAISAGVALNSVLSVELQAGYFEAVREEAFLYPSVGYLNNPIPGTRIRMQAAPISLDARVRLPTSPTPYLVLGAGFVVEHVTVDPPDFNATLRSTDPVPFFHGGLGVLFDLGPRWFTGIEARYFLTADHPAFGTDTGIAGITGAATLGFRP